MSTRKAFMLHPGGRLTGAGAMNEARSPHPVPLPLGEGTVWHAPSVIRASLLPEGEGQDEGLCPQSLIASRSLHSPQHAEFQDLSVRQGQIEVR